ncbi:TIGR03826 family flagellar region protein [Sporosarcina sp. HYO08]|uniref:TIGR03826 family flagellar region protein n=1 Tax=Sporosarcina sp. HYO08 TaxID=1759557 RepID=UPI00079488FA|nr:TIGR03826 family flagellar region protein [Sporosarcina sp. HYO08]KXH84134.1 hypothetical protein AU377_05165 [Sporosarcina sp. HYO08]
MVDLRNCPSCGAFFKYDGIRDVCLKCARDEEKIYEEVYRFLRRRENRAATIERIVEATGVSESLLYKWVRKGRLQPTQFPNLGYPCDQCGKLTATGKLCDACTETLKNELRTFEAAVEIREAVTKKTGTTYYSNKRKG